MRYAEDNRKFFMQSANVLAPLLLGKLLCKKFPDGAVRKLRITETEAYCEQDSASHSFGGMTKSNRSMFMIGGTAYAGGIAAYNYGIENSVAIQNCFNKGKVYATAYSSYGKAWATAFAGGIVGENREGVISQCYNNGNIESIVSKSDSKNSDFRAFAGGIAGDSNCSSPEYQSIIESYNSGNVYAQAQYPYAGGIAGTCCKAKNCYNIGTTYQSKGSATDVGYGIGC